MPTRVVHVSFVFDYFPDDTDGENLFFDAYLDAREGMQWTSANDDAIACGMIDIRKGNPPTEARDELLAMLRSIREKVGEETRIVFLVSKRGLPLFIALMWQHAPDFHCEFIEA